MDDSDLTPEPDAVRLVPEGIARTLRLVPMSAGPRTLTIAVAEPLTGEQLTGLITLTGRQLINQIEPGVAVVNALIESTYGDTAEAGSVSAA